MLGKRAVDAQLRQSLGLTIKKLEPILAVGGDAAEKQFMECCWSLWKTDGIELVEPFIDFGFQYFAGEVTLCPFPAHAYNCLFGAERSRGEMKRDSAPRSPAGSNRCGDT